MQHFSFRNNELFCEEVSLAGLAGEVGTPFYLYSQTALEERFSAFERAFATYPHITCFAVKANSNLAILRLFAGMGCGFDIVSGGELRRARRAGADPARIVFSGVGKTIEELDLALREDILQFNIESAAELEILDARARAAGRMARISIRINPDVDPGTHPHISTGLRQNKFGVPVKEASALCRRARRSKNLKVAGIGFHIGSQITRLQPFIDALHRLKEAALALRSQGVEIRHMDLGGGLGITYEEEVPPEPAAYAQAIIQVVRGLECTLLLEPGRVLVGNAGVLVTRVVLLKRNNEKRFVVVDAAMNDLIRPSLYGAYHAIQPVQCRRGKPMLADVVGPVCETGDFLAKDRKIAPVRGGDLLAVMSAGAYGFVLSSNYNSRTRPPEVLVKGPRRKIIRRRETFQDLIRGESANPL